MKIDEKLGIEQRFIWSGKLFLREARHHALRSPKSMALIIEGGLQNSSLAKVSQTEGKPHTFAQIASLRSRQRCAATAAASPPETSQT